MARASGPRTRGPARGAPEETRTGPRRSGDLVVVVAPPVTALEPLDLPIPESTAQASMPTVGVTEEQVTTVLRWIGDRLAEASGREEDRLADWEAAWIAPRLAKRLNEWFPDLASEITRWDPRQTDAEWPLWVGLFVAVARRVIPRMFEGRLVEWVERANQWLAARTAGQSEHG
jgi:hypothetical protein